MRPEPPSLPCFVCVRPPFVPCIARQVACKQLVGLYLSIWARKRVARHIRGIQATSAATGWGGYLGNKGAVAVRLRVHDAPLVVVCSHLASGDAKGDEQRRNGDVAEIMRRCVFANPDGQPGGWFGAAWVRNCCSNAPSFSHSDCITAFVFASMLLKLAVQCNSATSTHNSLPAVYCAVLCCRRTVLAAAVEQQQQQWPLGQHVCHPGPPQRCVAGRPQLPPDLRGRGGTQVSFGCEAVLAGLAAAALGCVVEC